MIKSKKIIRYAALTSVGLHLLMFLMYFIPYYVMEVDTALLGVVIYDYVIFYITKFLEFAIPVVACCLIYFADSSQKGGKAALRCLYIALGSLIYHIPDKYLTFMNEMSGISSSDALLISAIMGILEVILLWIYIMLLYAALRIVSKLLQYRKNLAALTPQKKAKLGKDDKKKMLAVAKSEIDAYPELGDTFDTSYPLCAGLFAAAFIQFIVYLVPEVIITSIQYLTSYAGTYTMDEIVSLIVSPIFLLLSLLAIHLINYKLSHLLRPKNEEEEQSE